MAEMVKLHNKLNQEVRIDVEEDGTLTSKKLAPRGRFGPVDKARLGKRTRTLAARGHIRIRPV